MKKFFFGIDQTGAVDRRGRPKALAASLIYCEDGGWHLSVGWIASLNFVELALYANREAAIQRLPKAQCVVAVDCVLGLPLKSDEPESLRSRFLQASQMTGYGRAVAETFFAGLRKAWPSGPNPRRRVEILCDANSVFTSRPFQKNIQTGTFRLWKDLAEDPSWYVLSNLEATDAQRVALIEGYPSLAWRQILEQPTRLLRNWHSAVRGVCPELEVSEPVREAIEQSADLADAATLALQAWKLRSEPYPRVPVEGWILGAPRESQ